MALSSVGSKFYDLKYVAVGIFHVPQMHYILEGIIIKKIRKTST